MWMFKCQFDNPNNPSEFHCISCLFLNNKEYIIGRASKSAIVVEEKGVSRVHLGITAKSELIEVQLLGSQMRLNNKAITKGEMLKFSRVASPVRLDIGSHNVPCTLEWLKWEIKIPSTLKLDEFPARKELNDLDITFVPSLSKDTTHQVVERHQDDREYDKYLFSLVKGIPLVEPGFLKGLMSSLQSNCNDFEQTVNQLLKQFSIFPNFKPQSRPLYGLHIILTKKDEYDMLKYTLELGGATTHLVLDIQTLGHFVSLLDTGKVMILTYGTASSASRKETLKRLEKITNSVGLQLTTVKDLVKAIVNENIHDILQLRSSEHNSTETSKPGATNLSDSSSNKRPIKEDPHKLTPDSQPVIKRRRTKRVQPLDSLSFFAGGVSNADVKTEGDTQLGAEQTTAHNDQLDTKKATESVKEETPKGRETRSRASRVKPLPNMMLRATDNDTHTIDSETTANSSIGQTSHQDIDSEDNITFKHELNPEAVVEQTRPSKRPPKSQDDEYSAKRSKTPSSPQTAIVDAIKEIKETEVNQIRSQIIEVAPDELTEEAITQLQCLAITKTMPMISRRSSNIVPANPEYGNRKNFKKFIKVWPKYMKAAAGLGKKTRKTTTTSKHFIPLEPYTTDNFRAQEFSTSECMPSHTSSAVSVHETAQPSTSTEEQPALFVIDGEDSDYEQTNAQPGAAHKSMPTSNEVDQINDDEEDDDGPKFAFRRSRRNK
ncbi:HFL253Wp [Eremothecium sinecaudum]|uniref:HFL253Wp n=1 Tax=Eremothecium sinecaudum TaxID=45286 RepID=A0A109V0A7_9SACH|nr:HFL253Wp [Eremothecium sinecaudum]AMD21603.1 HFL253Wp [Eremothecium sinecaudum]